MDASSPVRHPSATGIITEKRRESLSPFPRASRLKKKKEHRLKSQTLPPTAKDGGTFVTVQDGKDEIEKEEILPATESTYRSDDERSSGSRSVSPGPRVGRLRQLASLYTCQEPGSVSEVLPVYC